MTNVRPASPRAARLLASLLVLGAIAAALVGAERAQAQIPPTLATEFLLAQSLGDVVVPGDSFTASGSCLDRTVPTSYTFEAAGRAGGLFTGTFVQSGTFTIGPRTDFTPQYVAAWESEFTIYGPNGVVVTGTQHLFQSRDGVCFDTAADGRLVNLNARLAYEATFTTPSGTAHIEGISQVNLTDASSGPVVPGGLQVFSDAFVTSSPVADAPATVVLDPASAVLPAGAEHCVTATVRGGSGDALEGVAVRFSVSGVSSASGAGSTDVNGRTTFCYDGPTSPGGDAIRAFADSDADALEDPGEPFATAVASFFLPPPAPTSLVLEPHLALLATGAEHCLTATVLGTSETPLAGVSVEFRVLGATSASGAVSSGTDGAATFCYQGPDFPGVDAIRAFADTDGDSTEDATEPFDVATATFASPAREPAALTLEPPAAALPAGSQHCVTATVLDQVGASLEGTAVVFAVSGTSAASGSGSTDALGRSSFCYQGPLSVGSDTIRAYADSDSDGVEDVGEPAGVATATFFLPEPAVQTLTLAPATASNEVGTEQCVTATLLGASGSPVSGVTIRFAVTGASPASGVAVTGSGGTASFCYKGPGFPGVDAILAYADADSDGTQDADEAFGGATKSWALPGNGAGCTLADKGKIVPAGGGNAHFDGELRFLAGGEPHGRHDFDDHTAHLSVRTLSFLGFACDPVTGRATIYGEASVNGLGRVLYRADLADVNEKPGKGFDTFGIVLADGYSSGIRPLFNGNVEVSAG